jgi:acetoin:2,6-dichlorophenolindophenol oxidoreductase subunit alpha
MWLIRAFEERCSELYAQGRIPGLLHLSIGQEATAVGIASTLRPDDALAAVQRGSGAIAVCAELERAFVPDAADLVAAAGRCLAVGLAGARS